MAKFAVLNQNKDFRTLYYRGKSQVHPALITYARRNRLGHPRAGITASKKIGGAVQRNRCRRVIREAYRALLPAITGGWDLVLVARSRTITCKSTDLCHVLEKQLRALGVLPNGAAGHGTSETSAARPLQVRNTPTRHGKGAPAVDSSERDKPSGTVSDTGGNAQ